MRKKVLIIATIGGFLPVTEIHNVKLLLESGYEVHYAANLQNRIYEFKEQELLDLGIVLHQVDFSKDPFRFIQLGKCIRKVCKIIESEQISLVHCHTPVGGVAGRIASHLARTSNPYVIYTAHGFHFYKGAPALNWILYYPVEYLLSVWTDCMVTINREDYAFAKKMLCKKCVQIPGVGIDLKRFYPKKSRENKKFQIISVGELNENKNHSTVIKAIKMLKDNDIVYEIYGNGPEEKKLEHLIYSCNLESQVFLKGFVMDIENPLRKSDCCVFPSFREGLGLAALEAMACGVPLIAADNRGTREFAQHGINCLICEPGNAEQFAMAIYQIKENPVLAEKLTEHAYETVQNFSVEKSTEIMRKVYERI